MNSDVVILIHGIVVIIAVTLICLYAILKMS